MTVAGLVPRSRRGGWCLDGFAAGAAFTGLAVEAATGAWDTAWPVGTWSIGTNSVTVTERPSGYDVVTDFATIPGGQDTGEPPGFSGCTAEAATWWPAGGASSVAWASGMSSSSPPRSLSGGALGIASPLTVMIQDAEVP